MKTLKKLLLFFIFFTFCFAAFSQSDSVKKKVTWGAFADIFYSYNFNNTGFRESVVLANGATPIFSHNIHNAFSINNLVAGVAFADSTVRAALSLQTGTFVAANYAPEPTLFQLVYEAHAGVRITKDLWIDAGIFPSHLGAESAISMKDPTLTRSLMAENSPYFETGIKATWEPSEKLTLSGLILNGWQNIAENNENKAIGTQVTYSPSEKVFLNYSTFLGKEKPANGSRAGMRFFNNLYAAISFDKLFVLAGFDIGFQEKTVQSGLSTWFTPNLIVRYRLSEKVAIAGRFEYYSDPDGIIVYPGIADFETSGSSVNFDYKVTKRVLWRVEARVFNAQDAIYIKNNSLSKSTIFAITSLAFKLGDYSF